MAEETVGVIGTGTFGLTISNLLSRNCPVLIYARNSEIASRINSGQEIRNIKLAKNISATTSLQQIADSCHLIFPIVPSVHFRAMMHSLGHYIKPSHILIHGTKGLDLVGVNEDKLSEMTLTVENIRTMSEVITEESSAVRVGCLSGPNLASEILEGQPTATVIASEFEEVIKLGKNVLESNKFFVFGSHDILGAQLAGTFKNVIAIASGILEGMGLGRNLQALLITRGLREMIYFGKLMGSNSRAFLGTAGIGDLVATATSTHSRNFDFGYRLAKGETADEIIESVDDIAEGIRTLKIGQQLAKHYKLHAPITKSLYGIVYEGMDIMKSIRSILRYPFANDVDYL